MKLGLLFLVLLTGEALTEVSLSLTDRNCEYDNIVIGSGSAGAYVAHKLVKAGRKVLLIEKGNYTPEDLYDASFNSLLPKIFTPNPDAGFNRITDRMYLTTPQSAINNRVISSSRGITTGGSASHNLMLAAIGGRSEYSKWKDFFSRRHDQQDVSLNKIYAAFDKLLEDLEVTAIPNDDSNLMQRFIESIGSVGFPIVDNYNEVDSGVSAIQFTATPVNATDSIRKTTYSVYVEPLLNDRRYRNRLDILLNTTVKSLHFQSATSRTAKGVNVVDGSGEHYTIRARRGVVISTGAYETPKLLMLSGIGDRDTLESMGITVRKHLPGVGANLQEHLGAPIISLINPAIYGSLPIINLPNYQAMGFGPANNTETAPTMNLEVGLFPIPTEFLIAQGNVGLPPGLLVTTAAFTTLDSKARGTVKAASSDYLDYPLIDPKIFENPQDLQSAVTAFWTLRAALRNVSDIFNYEVVPSYEAVNTVQQSIDWLKDNIRLVGHPCCTARLGDDSMGVLNSDFSVRGIRGLYVVDASSMPTLPTANTNLPSMMIGVLGAHGILYG
jgi:choline dehydrogenase